MHIELLVEGRSDKEALDVLVPRIVGQQVSFDVRVFDSKRNLLSKLPGRMSGYAHWRHLGLRVVVLVDEDREDCRELRRAIEKAAEQAGLPMLRGDAERQVLVLGRIVIEELEAWYFGDPDALRTAYPRLPKSFERREAFRDPDAIAGGTWEQLERLLQRAGYHQPRLAKIQAARDIAPHMDVDRNASGSFQIFVDGLRRLVRSP
jgi:hypothetical protein